MGEVLKKWPMKCPLKVDLEIFVGNFTGKLPVKFRWYFASKPYS